jgi:hypothetical protein
VESPEHTPVVAAYILHDPRKWLNSSRVAEISHCGTYNFSFILEFKYIGVSDRKYDLDGLQMPPSLSLEWRDLKGVSPCVT